MTLFSAYGSLIFFSLMAPRSFAGMTPDSRAPIDRQLVRLGRWSLVFALLALLCWLLYEGAEMAEAASLCAVLAAAPTILFETSFGHVIGLQLAALSIALVLFRGDPPSLLRARLAALFGSTATLLQIGHSHALAMFKGPSLLLASDAVHVLSAGGWLGGLLPLLITVRLAPPKISARTARSFSQFGKICVGGVVVSAGFQGWVLIGGFPGLVGSAYGWVALGKFGLLIVLLVFAAINRYRFAPALLHGDGVAARRLLMRSLAAQTATGLLVICAAGILSSLPPALHIQPVWPFTQQLSLVTIQEDADFKKEVIAAIAALAGAVFIAAIGVAQKRLRWPAIMVSLLIMWFAVPHLDLLFVEAYPTSFYHSPTGFAATAIAEGAALYPQHCASCHGVGGRGNGPLAKGLSIAPADLTADHLWGHRDGELFWWLSHGIDAPEGGPAMPGFAGTLTENQRWDLIDYIRANNVGIARRSTNQWPSPIQAPPVHAPNFLAVCGSSGPLALAAFRGKVVRLVFGDAPVGVPPISSAQGVDVVTIAVISDPTPSQGQGCTAQDPAIWRAYSVISGIASDRLLGTQVLIDPNGWLRDVQIPGQAGTDPQALLAEIQQICTHPLADKEASHAHHHS